MPTNDIISKNILADGFSPIDINVMRPYGFHEERYLSSKKCYQKVEDGDGWLDIKCCPVCKSEYYDQLMNKYGINIVQCKQCTLGYCLKIPKNICDVYSDSQYLYQAQRDYEKNILYRMERFARERTGILRKWIDKKPEECSLLDIGCGIGWFLEFAKKEGFRIFGQEISCTLAAYTSKRLGIKIWSCPVSEIENHEGAFDVITMFDVLEHNPDPSVMISSVRRLLAPGGIALIFVPHLNSVGFAILSEESALVTPSEHLLYFTIKSIQHLAELNDINILHVETRGMDIPDLIAYYRDKKKDIAISDFLTQFADLLQSSIDESGRSNHMRIILQKPVHSRA